MRVLLFLLFFVLLAGNILGLNFRLAPGVNVKNAFLYLSFVGIAINTALARNRRIELPSVLIPFALLLLYAIFTWLVLVLVIDYQGYSAIDTLIGMKGQLADHLIVFLVFFYGILTAKDALWLIRMILWTVMLGNAISVLDALNLPDFNLIHEREDGRIGGPIGESNQYAAFLVLFLPGAVALAAMESGWRRVLAILGTGFSALALLMTASRGGILAAVFGAACALFFLRRFVSGRAVVAAVAGAIVLVLAALGIAYVTGYGELLYERLIAQSVGVGGFDATSGRSVIWSRTVMRMTESPISLVTGFGWDAYLHFPLTGFLSHNSYLKVFFELGAIGLCLYMAVLANVLRVGRDALRYSEKDASPLLFASITGVLSIMTAIFFVDLFEPWLFAWAYIGVYMRLAVTQIEYAGRHHRPSSTEYGLRYGVSESKERKNMRPSAREA